MSVSTPASKPAPTSASTSAKKPASRAKSTRTSKAATSKSTSTASEKPAAEAKPAAAKKPATAKASAAKKPAAAAKPAASKAAAAKKAPAKAAASKASKPVPPAPRPIGRIPATEIFPSIEDGTWPAKGVVGEPFPVRATVFREGHDAFGAAAVLVDPDGKRHSEGIMYEYLIGLNRFEGWVCPDREGLWSFHVESWSDPYATWVHDATIKIDAGVDVELMLTEGSLLFKRAADRRLAADVKAAFLDAAQTLADDSLAVDERLAAGLSDAVKEALAKAPLRDQLSTSESYFVDVDRPLAQTGAWYEMFPRSEGAYFDPVKGGWVSGTFAAAIGRLEPIADMGFDVVYLTPIHPIGVTNRKGRNNSLRAREGDPGSPYAIGSEAGGHDALIPFLGTMEDFNAFVARARELGMEVAMDLALQCSPDHPWLKEHPEWFKMRADGTIAYAENPPKKYQDIYPLYFDNDPDGLYHAIVDVLETWVERGVTIFRVDNPHTKPLDFWQRTLAYFREKHPEVIFLAEAFTKPAMMRTLGAIGFHQSYTYFAWRNTREELTEYLLEVHRETSHVLRPSFWPTTHDILTPYMQSGGVAAFKIRAILAAMGSPTYGIYSGYEFVENIARPGAEEQIDNEKYEFKPRDWSRTDDLGMVTLLTKLNDARRRHPALQQLHSIAFHGTSNDSILAFSKRKEARFNNGVNDVVLVIVNVDPYITHEGMVYLNYAELGLPAGETLQVTDELTGETYWWRNEAFVRLDPHERPAHVLSVRLAKAHE